MSKILIRYFKFLGTSIVGTIVDTLVLWFLSDLIFNHAYWAKYILSPVISFQCAVTVNFLISYFYVWKDRQVKTEQGEKRRFFKQYATYNLSSLGVFIFRLIILLAIERLTGWDVVICNLLTMGVSGVLNFIINNLIIFKKRKT
jgi:putative flippase GtrA